MASIFSKLAPKDRQVLATFYEQETYNSLKKLLKLIKDNSAQHAINAIDFHQVKWLQGQHTAIELLEKELEKIFEWSQKH